MRRFDCISTISEKMAELGGDKPQNSDTDSDQHARRAYRLREAAHRHARGCATDSSLGAASRPPAPECVAQPRTNPPSTEPRTLTIGNAEPRNRPRKPQATAKPRCDPSSRITHPQRHTTASEKTRHDRQRRPRCHDIAAPPHATSPKAPLLSGRGANLAQPPGIEESQRQLPATITQAPHQPQHDDPTQTRPSSPTLLPAGEKGEKPTASADKIASPNHAKALLPLGRGVELSLRCPTRKGPGRLHWPYDPEIGTRR